MELLSTNSQICLRPIERADWDWIQHWFQDEWLNRELGPVDANWLEHVLTSNEGVELVALRQNEPIGLVGVLWATPDHPFNAITDLAIAPELRRQGLGNLVLKRAMNWPGHPATNAWVAHVAHSNKIPAKLLTSLGWKEVSNNQDMRRFVFEVS